MCRKILSIIQFNLILLSTDCVYLCKIYRHALHSKALHTIFCHAETTWLVRTGRETNSSVLRIACSLPRQVCWDVNSAAWLPGKTAENRPYTLWGSVLCRAVPGCYPTHVKLHQSLRDLLLSKHAQARTTDAVNQSVRSVHGSLLPKDIGFYVNKLPNCPEMSFQAASKIQM